jgi:hypothetical protein
MACINLFTLESNASARFLSISGSSTESSGTLGYNHIIWQQSELSWWNPGVAVPRCLNTILTSIAICQSTQFLVLNQWDSSQFPALHNQHKNWPLLDGIALDVKVSWLKRWIINQFSSLSILLFTISCVRFAFSACHSMSTFNSVPKLCHPFNLALQ